MYCRLVTLIKIGQIQHFNLLWIACPRTVGTQWNNQLIHVHAFPDLGKLPQDAIGIWIFNDDLLFDNLINTTTMVYDTSPMITASQYSIQTAVPTYNGNFALRFSGNLISQVIGHCRSKANRISPIATVMPK